MFRSRGPRARPPVACNGIAAAGVLFLWCVCSWNMVARANRFPTLWPVVRIRQFSLLLCLLFLSYLAEETLFRGRFSGSFPGWGPPLRFSCPQSPIL